MNAQTVRGINSIGKSNRSLFHKQPRIVHKSAGSAKRWPGLVYAGGNQFYDAQIVPVAEQVGDAIVDNSEGVKEWVFVECIGNATTDPDAFVVSYEVGPPPTPWEDNAWWFRTRDFVVPITILDVFGAQAQNLVYQRLLDVAGVMVYGFGRVDQSVIDVTGITAGKIGYANAQGALTWDWPPEMPDEYFLLPYGSKGDILYHSTSDWVARSKPSGPAILIFDNEEEEPVWLVPTSDYQVPYRMTVDEVDQIVCDDLRAT